MFLIGKFVRFLRTMDRLCDSWRTCACFYLAVGDPMACSRNSLGKNLFLLTPTLLRVLMKLSKLVGISSCPTMDTATVSLRLQAHMVLFSDRAFLKTIYGETFECTECSNTHWSQEWFVPSAMWPGGGFFKGRSVGIVCIIHHDFSALVARHLR